ncbi:MAG: hypothetical protein ACFCD0_15165 [Gemmataceae bacterium]
MNTRRWKPSLVALLVLVGGLGLAVSPVAADGWGLGFGSWGCNLFGGCREQCPPPYTHCQEGPPRLHFKRRCPRPVCHPCKLQHYGYYQPCWRPWPFPRDFRHCPGPVPAAEVPPAPPNYAHAYGTPNTNGSTNPEQLPPPNKRQGDGTPTPPNPVPFPPKGPIGPGVDPGDIPPFDNRPQTGPLKGMTYRQPRPVLYPR